MKFSCLIEHKIVCGNDKQTKKKVKKEMLSDNQNIYLYICQLRKWREKKKSIRNGREERKKRIFIELPHLHLFMQGYVYLNY